MRAATLSGATPRCQHIAMLAGVFLLPLLCSCASMRGEVHSFLAGPPPFPGLVGNQDPSSLSEEQIDRRLAFLEQRLDDTETHAKAWQYGWLTINAGGAIVSGAQAGFDHGNDRVYDALEAGKSTIGTVYLLTSPMPGRHGAEPIRALASATRADKLAQLERAERLFRETVRRSEERSSLLMHVGNAGLNIVTGAVLLGLDEPRLAAMSFFLDTAVGEVQIWTQPWEPPKDWQDYERFVATGLPQEPRTSWHIAPTGRGLALQIDF
jgi:hypothetical protein